MLTIFATMAAQAADPGAARADGDEPRPRIVSVAGWLPVGGTLRWNEALFDGVSLLVDGAYRIRVADAGPQWRWIGGLDLGNGSLTGNYVGIRGGVLRAGGGPTGRTPVTALPVTSEPVIQAVVGHKWISGHTAVQLGAGLQARYPEDDDVVGPLVELRLGYAAGGS